MQVLLSSFCFSVVVTILLFSSFSLTSAQPDGVIDERYYICSPTNGMFASYSALQHGSDAPYSAFADNLETLLNAVKTESPFAGGFYNRTVGHVSGVDQVNGMGLCRGDLNSSDCNTCLSDASQNLRQRCLNETEAIMWYTDCMFRYSFRTIIYTEEKLPRWDTFSLDNVSDPTSFKQQRWLLLRSLQDKAVAGDFQSKYADGSAVLDDSQKVYALVQCTPDLSAFNCSDCIDSLINHIPSCCAESQGAYILSPSCTLRFNTTQFYSTDAHDSNSSIVIGKQASKKGGTPIITFVIPAVIWLVIVLFICGCCLLRRNRRQKAATSSLPIHEADDEINRTDSLHFDFGIIRAATNAFSDANKLGRGGFGDVYKGILSNGQEVAVKRLARNAGQGELEFRNEVLFLAKLQHRNLVRLLGFCLEGDERLLMYEFVPNRSLDHFLFDPEKRSLLNWQTRYNIIAGIARGLLYLHEDSRLRIIHRDLKPSNILLDAEMIPKIADFGLAKLFEVDQTHGDTSRVAGTYGYMAPEYALHGLFSGKSDVFSFGVLVLEMITGRKSISLYEGEKSEDLISWVWRNWRQGTVADVVDETMADGSRTEMMRCVHIGLLCVQEDASDRPTMSSVVIMLNTHSFTLPVVSQPAYITRSPVPMHTVSEEHSSEGANLSESKSTESSINVHPISNQFLPQ